MSAKRKWIARILVATVFFVNVQCAVQFIVWPDAYTTAYQLEGTSAEAIVRSFGICFLMWNATYPPVIAHPERFRVLFAVVIAQQAIGLVGETALLTTFDSDLGVLTSSVMRFIAFDAGGLLLLAASFTATRTSRNELQGSSSAA